MRISPAFLKPLDTVGNPKVSLKTRKLTAALIADSGTERIDEYHFMYTPEIRVHLIDTPGFDDAHRSERETLTDLAEWMSQSHGATARLTGIIYLHRISVS